jgi:Fe-S-cluster containining protein
MELAGLEIEDGEDGGQALLIQPCGALKGKRCSIYAHRPKCCRTFECLLLNRASRGEISVETGLAKICEAVSLRDGIRRLLKPVKKLDGGLTLKEHCVEAIESGQNQSRGAELERALAAFERIIQESFLGAGVSA